MTKRKKKHRASTPARVSVAAAPIVGMDGDGLVHLAIVACVCVALALATYASRTLLRFRPWEPGEGIPIVRLFERPRQVQATSAAAPAGPIEPEGADVAAPEPPLDPILLAAATSEEPVDEAPTPPPTPELTPLVIAPSETAGLPLEIEDTTHAMDAFYRSLDRTAHGEPVVTRVAHFGDSTIAFDGITQTVRERMQHRFGDAGSGFVLVTRGTLPYGHHHVRTESEGAWQLMDITHHGLSDGRYGLGGGRAQADAGASAWFETPESSVVGTSVSRFEVMYQRYERGGRFDYRVDDGAWVSVDTRISGESESEGSAEGAVESESESAGAREEDAVVRVDVPAGRHRLSIRTMGHGQARFYGVVLDNGDRGVAYDSLGMVGARAQRMLEFDPQHLRTQLAQRDVALVIVQFGGNDADDDREQDEFEYTYRRVARLVRQARPDASCLLMAPLDQAERDERGTIATLPTIPRIVEAMRSAARHEGCAFFDTWNAMGGDGSMGRWFHEEPRLAGGDFRHATPGGYRVIGEMLYRALLTGLRRHERTAHAE
jgi:lysophospholipase L1-like esterase